MSYKLIRTEDYNSYIINHFIIDSISDADDILTDYQDKLHSGWTAKIVVDGTDTKYLLDHNFQWGEVQESSGGGGVTPTISVGSDGLITAQAGTAVEMHQLSSTDDADFVAENIKSGVTIFGTTGALPPATIPSIGFVPTKYHSSGSMQEGIYYGTTVPMYYFYCPGQGSGGFSRLQNIIFNDQITSYGNYCFLNCFYLKINSFPSTVETIGNQAFRNCKGIINLTFNGTPASIASNAFQDCDDLTIINVPWAEEEVANAPWGATNATINYNYTPS